MNAINGWKVGEVEMRVENWFDDDDTINRNRNKLRISSTKGYPNCVEVAILDVDGGTVIEETVVDGMELIKAIQNAMNAT